MDNRKITLPSLTDLVRLKVKPLLRRYHLNPDNVTILVGDRGDGKTTTGARLVLIDDMMAGDKCASNIQIKCTVTVSDEEAAPYGLKGGEVVYEAEPLDKTALLHLRDRYRGYHFFIDEINVYMGDARRAMSNTNLEASDLGQQLRHLQAGLTATVIDEMFVEPRIREIADTFIRCEDTALSPEGLANRRQPGAEIKWLVYPMSRKLCGMRYGKELHQPIGPFFIPNKTMWGTIDTMESQDRSKYKVKANVDGVEATIELTRNERTLQVEQQWGWLYDKLVAARNQEINEIRDDILWEYLNLKERGINPKEVGKQLSHMGVPKHQIAGGRYAYIIDQFNIDKLDTKKVAALAQASVKAASLSY